MTWELHTSLGRQSTQQSTLPMAKQCTVPGWYPTPPSSSSSADGLSWPLLMSTQGPRTACGPEFLVNQMLGSQMAALMASKQQHYRNKQRISKADWDVLYNDAVTRPTRSSKDLWVRAVYFLKNFAIFSKESGSDDAIVSKLGYKTHQRVRCGYMLCVYRVWIIY